MKRCFAFTSRNLKEIIRDPLSLIFCFIFPVASLLLMELIINSVAVDFSQTPQFQIQNLFPSICIFSFTFLTLFASILISKDRASSFQARLNASPLKPIESIAGYILALVPIALIQVALVLGVSFCFGLQFSWNILLSIVMLIPSFLLFTGFGILIGVLCGEKAVGGISSLIINAAVLLGGMFFPLQIMKGVFPTICKCLPFQPALSMVSSAITNDYSQIWTPIVTVIGYTLVVYAFAVWAFYKKMKSDKR